MKTQIKIEEGAMFALAFWLSMQLGFDWWLFIVLLFIPDVSMAGYLAGNMPGAVIYNLFHNKAVAIVTGLSGILLNNQAILLSGLVLFGHSSFDRMFGFGPKPM